MSRSFCQRKQERRYICCSEYLSLLLLKLQIFQNIGKSKALQLGILVSHHTSNSSPRRRFSSFSSWLLKFGLLVFILSYVLKIKEIILTALFKSKFCRFLMLHFLPEDNYWIGFRRRADQTWRWMSDSENYRGR